MSTAPIALPRGIHFIERDWLSANHVVFVDGDGHDRAATLVDTGYVKHAPMTVSLIGRLLEREGVPRLTRVLNTHLHSDHCGGNAAIAGRFGASVYVPQAEYDAVHRWDEAALTFMGTGQRCERFTVQGSLAPGDVLRLAGADWHLLAAPGHDPHSLLFHCPEHRILLSADALWGNGFGVIFPELSGQSGFAEQAAVLDLIDGLDVDVVIPGHGPMFTDVKPAIARARSRLQAFLDDPTRNGRNALKVLVKFLLLDEERMAVDTLHAHARGASIMVDAARQAGTDIDTGLTRAIAELLAQGQIARDGDLLVNR